MAAKQSTPVKVDFGCYCFISNPTDQSDLRRFAEDITLTVETLLLAMGGADLDNDMEDGLKAAGEVLQWARECLQFHGTIGRTTERGDE